MKQLPNELLLEIAKAADQDVLVALMSTSSVWRSISLPIVFSQSKILVYHICSVCQADDDECCRPPEVLLDLGLIGWKFKASDNLDFWPLDGRKPANLGAYLSMVRQVEIKGLWSAISPWLFGFLTREMPRLEAIKPRVLYDKPVPIEFLGLKDGVSVEYEQFGERLLTPRSIQKSAFPAGLSKLNIDTPVELDCDIMSKALESCRLVELCINVRSVSSGTLRLPYCKRLAVVDKANDASWFGSGSSKQRAGLDAPHLERLSVDSACGEVVTSLLSSIQAQTQLKRLELSSSTCCQHLIPELIKQFTRLVVTLRPVSLQLDMAIHEVFLDSLSRSNVWVGHELVVSNKHLRESYYAVCNSSGLLIHDANVLNMMKKLRRMRLKLYGPRQGPYVKKRYDINLNRKYLVDHCPQLDIDVS